MTLIKPKQAAEILGISPSALRSWEQAGIITPALRFPSGHRRYSHAEIWSLKLSMEIVRAQAEEHDA